MAKLYHCFYREPEGEAILASCFRTVNGQSDHYLFAATHLTKSLAFAFSYHDNEVLMNAGIDGTENELVVLCGGQKTLDKARHIRVFEFADEGFEELPYARQAVSVKDMPFSMTTKIMDTQDIDDLMRSGLQIFLLPEDVSHYMIGEDNNVVSRDYFRPAETHGEAMAGIMKDLGARWVNHERGVGSCPTLWAQMQTDKGEAARPEKPQHTP